MQTINLLASALGQSPPGSPIARPIAIDPSSPESQGPISPPMREIQRARSPNNAGVYMPESPIRQNVSPLGFDCDSPTPTSPSAIERCKYTSFVSYSSCCHGNLVPNFKKSLLQDQLADSNFFLAHLAQSAKVRYWGGPVSVVRRASSTIT